MNENQTIAISQPVEVSGPQSAAWLSMALAKNKLVNDLSKMELQSQSILLPVKSSEDYKKIDEAAAAYRKLHTDIIELRKPFTNAIDTGIVQPLMAFEKRVDPKNNEDYLLITSRSLALRKAESDKAALTNQKNAEISRFKGFVENEFFRVAAEYRALLRREILAQYRICLESGLSNDTTDIKLMMKTLPIPPINKFQTSILTKEGMFEIYTGVPKPDYIGIYNEYMIECDGVFANFESDKANAAAAIAHQEQQNKLADIEEQKALNEEMAMNTLIATSETVTIEEPKIKRTLQVVIIESEQWAKSVMAAFVVNLPNLGDYIRVKSWSKLTVGQMATALGQLATKTGVVNDKLQYKEVEK